MSRKIESLCKICPYLTAAEIKSIWQQAKNMAAKKRIRGLAFWSVTYRIAKAIAMKKDEERRNKDEQTWLEERRRRSEGDWE